MHNHFKRFSCIALALVLMLACTSAFACTGYYVGKDASENGTYIIGHTVDASTTFQSKQVVVPHSDEPGRTFQIAMTIDQMFAAKTPSCPPSRCRIPPTNTPPLPSWMATGPTPLPTRWA